MPDQRFADDAAAKTGAAGAQAKIGLFVNEKEARVQQANAAEHLGRNHHATAVDDVHFRHDGWIESLERAVALWGRERVYTAMVAAPNRPG